MWESNPRPKVHQRRVIHRLVRDALSTASERGRPVPPFALLRPVNSRPVRPVRAGFPYWFMPESLLWVRSGRTASKPSQAAMRCALSFAIIRLAF